MNDVIAEQLRKFQEANLIFRPEDDAFMTAEEWSGLIGKSPDHTRRLLKRMVKNGTAEAVDGKNEKGLPVAYFKMK